MRSWALLASAACALWAVTSCDSSLSLDDVLEGRPCRVAANPADQCLPGYSCDARNICVRDGDGAGGSAVGQSGSSGIGGQSAGGGEGGSGGSNQGEGGTGAGGSSQGGAGGAMQDAGSSGFAGHGGAGVSDASVPADGCVPGPLYRDRDGDGYGSEAPGDVELGCARNGYVSVGGDCHDEVRGMSDRPDLVHPGQTQFLYELNLDPSKPQGISYDFDCSGQEEPDPALPGPPVCPTLLGGLDCSGTGYGETGRTGAGINPLCGSETTITCEPQALTQCVANFGSADFPFGCR